MNDANDPFAPPRDFVTKHPWILRAFLVIMFLVTLTIFLRFAVRGRFTLGDSGSKMLISREVSPVLFWVFLGIGAFGPIAIGIMTVQSFAKKKEADPDRQRTTRGM